MEREQRSSEQDRRHLTREIETMRDLLTQSQQGKDDLTRQLALVSSEADRMRENIERIARERDMIDNQLQAEV